MKVQGKIIWASPQKSGITKAGMSYIMKTFVIEIPSDATYPERMAFVVFGEEKIEKMGLAVGKTGLLTVEMHAREYKGRWYNNIGGLKFEPGEIQQPEESTDQNSAVNDEDIPF